MDKLPFAYVALGVLLAVFALAAWIAAFVYFRQRPSQLSAKDKVIGFLVAGPFFGALHSSLSSRGYRLTRREVVGLALVLGVALVLIAGSIVSAYAGT